MESLDLAVVVADLDAEVTIRTLLERRREALGIRPIRFKIVRHKGRDPGVYRDAPEVLRPFLKQARHALVLFDLEGSGQEPRPAPKVEEDLEQRLAQNGWAPERVRVIALDPELEVWVWSRSPHVARCIGLPPEELERFLAQVPKRDDGKPSRPKETLQQALRRSGRPFSAAFFEELAERVSLRAGERAFVRFRETLQTWFPRTAQEFEADR